MTSVETKQQQDYEHLCLIHNLVNQSNLLTFKSWNNQLRTASTSVHPVVIWAYTYPILTAARLHEKLVYGYMLVKNGVILSIYEYINKYNKMY